MAATNGNITSQRVEKLDVQINYKEGTTKQSDIEETFIRDLRQSIGGFITQFAEQNDVDSIDIDYHLEDN